MSDQTLVVPNCQACGRPMVKRRGPHSEFWGCSQYPRCKATIRTVSAATLRTVEPLGTAFGYYSREDEYNDVWGYDDGAGNKDGRP